MAAVSAITTTRVRDGKFQDAMGQLAKLKEIIEKAGGKFGVVTQMYGPNPGTMTVVVETAGWAEFGALGAKLETDADYLAFIAAARANPWSDIVTCAVSAAVDV